VPDTTASFGPDDRIRARSEFQAVQGRGRKVHTAHYLMLVLPRTDERSRLGLTVTKKIGTAVERNRVKRVFREVYRLNRTLFPSGFDLVVIAKSGAPKLGYADALAEVQNAGSALDRIASKARLRGA
jgi:ribonuclease P protein component